MIQNIKVSQFSSDKGTSVNNQFTITTPQGEYFQSYNSIIAFKENITGKITLDNYYWNYSRTTSKYRSQFLNESTDETKKKIASGVYTLSDLNK